MSSYSDPARNAIAVTPSDTTDIQGGLKVRGIYVGGAGNISMELDNGTAVFYGAVAGTTLPYRPKRINATGTTATNLLGVW